MAANTERAMAITAPLNRVTFNDADEIRALFSQLIFKSFEKASPWVKEHNMGAARMVVIYRLPLDRQAVDRH